MGQQSCNACSYLLTLRFLYFTDLKLERTIGLRWPSTLFADLNLEITYNYINIYMSGAIGGFAQSADRAARFADPHIAQLICRSRSYRKIAQA